MNKFFSYSPSVIGLFFFLTTLFACSSDDDDNGSSQKVSTANRTVLVYVMAENSLSSYVSSDIDEMLSGSSSIPDDDHLIIFVDDASSTNMPRIYEVVKASGKTEAYTKLVKQYDEEVCSTDPGVLEEVLEYVKSKYPANGYGLVMWSHGSGWLLADETKDSRSIGIDNEKNSSSDSGVEMNISDLAGALADFGKLDFLYFDACFMQGIEVAYELRNVTDYVIGSPAETPVWGARYDCILSSMFSSTADIKGIVNGNFSYYKAQYDTGDWNGSENYGCVMSAVKCSELDELAEITAPLIAEYAQDGQQLYVSGVQDYRGNFTSSSYPDYYDFNGVMYNNATTSQYEEWLEQFERTVLYGCYTAKWYSRNNWYSIVDESVSPFGGVSVYVPKNNSNYTEWNEELQETAWYDAVWVGTGW